jgi:hypothetical protein
MKNAINRLVNLVDPAQLKVIGFKGLDLRVSVGYSTSHFGDRTVKSVNCLLISPRELSVDEVSELVSTLCAKDIVSSEHYSEMKLTPACLGGLDWITLSNPTEKATRFDFI